mmetsp:Transcript_41054/g.126754  ORF Transcript_41054/g.126754 Transcript_41054/m.126754 type:complete len:202 (-) Transcript_41054:1394-1999(-)
MPAAIIVSAIDTGGANSYSAPSSSLYSSSSVDGMSSASLSDSANMNPGNGLPTRMRGSPARGIGGSGSCSFVQKRFAMSITSPVSIQATGRRRRFAPKAAKSAAYGPSSSVTWASPISSTPLPRSHSSRTTRSALSTGANRRDEACLKRATLLASLTQWAKWATSSSSKPASVPAASSSERAAKAKAAMGPMAFPLRPRAI